MTRRPPHSIRIPEATATINARLGTDYSEVTIRKFCRTGRIRSFQPNGPGGRRYITRAALEEFISGLLEAGSETLDTGDTGA